MTFDMTTANVLRSLMAERGLTQVQLADELGVSRQSVSRWLKGYPIDDKNLKKLAAYFGISEQELRFGRAAPVSVYDEGDTPPDDVVVIHEYRLTFGAAAEGREPEPEWEIVEGGDDFWYKRSFFQKRYLNPDKCKRAKVTGDSMEPFIFSGDRYGLINGLLLSLGIIQEPIRWLTDPAYMLGVIILVQLWMSLGAGFLAFIAGLQSVDRSLYESGAIDGIKNRWQELWHITLPTMKPQLMFGAVMQIASSFAAGSVCSALAGFPSTDYAAHTVILHVQDVGTLRYEMGYASAISVVLFIAMILVKSIIGAVLRED